MNEISISRKEAIIIIDNSKPSCGGITFTEEEKYEAFNKAISDMEKLEKIEQILGADCLSEDSEKCDFDGLCNEHAIRMIEQIVKS